MRRQEDVTHLQKDSMSAELEQAVTSWRASQCSDHSKQIQICELYASGADLPPMEDKGEYKPRKVKLPVYAFERKTHWLDIPDVSRVSVKASEQPFHVIRWMHAPLDSGTSWMSSVLAMYSFYGEISFIVIHL